MKNLNILLTGLLFYMILSWSGPVHGTYNDNLDSVLDHAPPSIQMTEYLLRWSSLFDIPYRQLKNASKQETNFKGLYHFTYNPSQTSSAAAEGPLQILLPTAKLMNPDIEFSREYLRTNIRFNTYTGAKYARYLKDRYNQWILVWSFYNQGGKGLTNINSYAREVVAYN